MIHLTHREVDLALTYSLTGDASDHLKACPACAAMIDRERSRNPLLHGAAEQRSASNELLLAVRKWLALLDQLNWNFTDDCQCDSYSNAISVECEYCTKQRVYSQKLRAEINQAEKEVRRLISTGE